MFIVYAYARRFIVQFHSDFFISFNIVHSIDCLVNRILFVVISPVEIMVTGINSSTHIHFGSNAVFQQIYRN